MLMPSSAITPPYKTSHGRLVSHHVQTCHNKVGQTGATRSTCTSAPYDFPWTPKSPPLVPAMAETRQNPRQWTRCNQLLRQSSTKGARQTDESPAPQLRDHGPGLSSDSLWVSSTWAPLLRISVRTARLLLLSISIPRTGTERPHLRLSALMWATEEPHGGNLQNLEIMSWSHPELGTRAPRRRPAPFAAVARVRAADMPSVRLFLFRSASGAVRMRDWPCVLPDLNLPVRSPVSGGCSRNHCNRSVAARSSSLSQCRGLLTAPAAGSANDRHAIHLPWSYTVCLQMLQCQP